MIELRTPTSDDYPAMCRQIHESFGGVSPFTLHAGRRLEARSPEALRRATLLFRTYPDPSCQTPF